MGGRRDDSVWQLLVDQQCPLSALSEARTTTTAGFFLDNTNSPGVPSFRYDWQGVLESVPNGYGLNVQGDVDPDGFGYNWTLTSACGTFTNPASPIPGHIPPSSISGNSVTGALTLEVMAGTVHAGATNSKQIVIQRPLGARRENPISPRRASSLRPAAV